MLALAFGVKGSAMPRAQARRALAEKRPLLVLSVLAALAYYYLRAAPVGELYLILLRGSAVLALALYAWLRHSGQDARLLAIALTIASAGEMALRLDLGAGVALWFGHHLVALMLYLRHRRTAMSQTQKWTAVALLLGTPLFVALLPADPRLTQPAAFYGLALGAMAGAAWTSSFPRYRVGAGAVLVVIAHLLSAAELGVLAGSVAAQVFIWPLTYLGLLLVATGVTRTLHKREPELRLVSSREG
ncbi:MAG: hypothetical protein B7Z33_04950 [Sphingomonadales bacterium 12-68-11]|nr:MAG: hypothetical protein B7Z33_04950 [Sphingomonadales bacterium 12-68-11]